MPRIRFWAPLKSLCSFKLSESFKLEKTTMIPQTEGEIGMIFSLISWNSTGFIKRSRVKKMCLMSEAERTFKKEGVAQDKKEPKNCMAT
jgi:hypothetical protein